MKRDLRSLVQIIPDVYSEDNDAQISFGETSDIILEKIIGILNSYPLKQEEEDIYQEVQVIKPRVFNPEIIITESFSN